MNETAEKPNRKALVLPLLAAVIILGGFGYRGIRQQQLNAALFDAINRLDAPGIELAIKKGANVNGSNASGGLFGSLHRLFRDRKRDMAPLSNTSPLASAALKGSPACVKVLLEHGADPRLRDGGKMRPFDYLLAGFYTGSNQDDSLSKIIKMLAEHGADPNERDDAGLTRLQYVFASMRPKYLKALLDAGADPNLPMADGNAPLTKAIDLNNVDMVRDLISHGANIHSRTHSKMTALEYAKAKKSPNDIIDLLKKSGAEE